MYKHAAHTASLLLPGLNMLSLGLIQASGVFDCVLKPVAKISRKNKHKKCFRLGKVFAKHCAFTLVAKISRKKYFLNIKNYKLGKKNKKTLCFYTSC